MISARIYRGFLTHARKLPRAHHLRTRLFMILFNLDALDCDARALWFFSHNRFNLVSLTDRDYGDRSGAPLRKQVIELLRRNDIACECGAIKLLTMPRILGFAFNPLSLYFCYRPAGGLAAIVYEVTNTFGERHSYVLPVDGDVNGRVQQSCAKRFYVSPFMATGLYYDFDVRLDDKAVGVVIEVREARRVLMRACFSGSGETLCDRALFLAFLAYPLMTVGAVYVIHWHALRMLIKGIPYLGRGADQRARRNAKIRLT